MRAKPFCRYIDASCEANRCEICLVLSAMEDMEADMSITPETFEHFVLEMVEQVKENYSDDEIALVLLKAANYIRSSGMIC